LKIFNCQFLIRSATGIFAFAVKLDLITTRFEIQGLWRTRDYGGREMAGVAGLEPATNPMKSMVS
jgi:hypothetical protein